MAEPRRKVPMKVALYAALYQLGFDPAEVELDHDPALGLSPVDPITGAHTPHQHDPKALVWRPKADHRRKTFGTKATTAGSDIHRIAHTRRLSNEEAEFRARLLAKDRGEPVPRQGTIRSAGFRKMPKAKSRCQAELARMSAGEQP